MTINAEKLLNQYAKLTALRKATALGYPCSQELLLTDFYEWLLKNKLDTTLLNNAGDPFDDHANFISALSFERDVIEFFGPKYGFAMENLWGLVTTSGTDGNNHGLYFGAAYLKNLTNLKPIVYISKDAHYSNMRLCDLQNLEFKIIDTDTLGCMKPEAFEEALDPTRPALVVYALGTTFKGGIDNQEKLNEIIEKKKPIAVYRHVDAALFGGYLPFTKYKDLVDRNVQHYDSIAISCHKYFGLDEPAGLFLTSREILKAQKSFNIAYLNSDMPMINCSRSGLASLKLWWLINHGGEDRWTREATQILENTAWLCKQFDEINYAYYINEASNTIFMERPSEYIIEKYGMATSFDEELQKDMAHVIVMQHVNKQLLGHFLIDLKAEIGL